MIVWYTNMSGTQSFYVSSRHSAGKKHPAREEKAVALVLCLVMLVVIVAFVIGLSTWIVGEYRVARGTKNRVLAENNALLGLDLGLAKLQMLAGPDRRVTAQAGITNSVTGANRYWTGVWDSTKGVRKADGTVDYQAKENLGWLVSGSNLNPAQYSTVRTASGMPQSPDDVMLLGAGTIGAANAANNSIILPKMPLMQDDPSGVPAEAGHYAYWVGDEGVKARINVALPTPDATETTWDKIFRQSVSPREQVKFSPTFGAITSWETFSNNKDALGCAWGADDLYSLAPDSADSYFSSAQESFQDFGFWSTGLLTNVKDGGIRKDLTRVFEASQSAFETQSSFAEFVYNSFGEKNWVRSPTALAYNPNIPIGYLFTEKIPGIVDGRGAKAVRGPTWHSLRNLYRQYKREYESAEVSGMSSDAWNARGSYPNAYDVITSSFSITSNSGYYLGAVLSYGANAAGGVDPWAQPSVLVPGSGYRFTNQPTDMGLAPVLTRLNLIFSLQSFPGEIAGTNAVNLIVDVIGAVQNPYDVPIEFDAFDVSFNFNVYDPNKIDPLDPAKKKYGTYASPWTILVAQSGSSKEITIPSLFHYNYPTTNVGDESNSSITHWRFVVTDDGTKNPSRRVRLEPGEIMGFSVEGPAPQQFEVLPARRGWNRMSGMRLKKIWPSGNKNSAPLELVLSGTKGISVSLPTITAMDSSVRLTTSIPAPGKTGALFLPPPSGGANRLCSREVQEIVYASNSQSALPTFPTVPTVYTETDLLQKRNIAALDIQLKSGDSSSPVSFMSANNSRAAVQVPLGNGVDAANRQLATSPSYDWKLIPITTVEDLNIPITSAGNGRWGSSQTASGETHVSLWEVAQAPWINLASLRNADVGVSSTHQSHAIGNSFPSPYVSFDKVYQSNNTSLGAGTLLGFTASDSSYLANEALSDEFYFSTIFGRTDKSKSEVEVADSLLSSGEDKSLPNPRITLFDRAKQGTASGTLLDPLKNGAELAIKGAFNINSVSKEAWKAVLAGHFGLKPLVKDNGGHTSTENDGVNTFFPRFSVPSKAQSSVWDSGYHSLTAQQIDKLAEKIVEQVRLRGPFLSLSEFINRRLENSDLGKAGALQSAIDAAELNKSVTNGSAAPQNSSSYSNSAALTSSVYTGAPNFLTQSDILAAIGPNISARSDTFRIRAYGDSKNPRTGRIEARMWCEAIVQRTPEFVDSTNAAETPVTVIDSGGSRLESPTLTEINKKLGRRFRIVSFRWLREDEV